MARRRIGKKNKLKSLDRPFEASILCDAERTVANYRFVLERNEREGYNGSSVELPTVLADGRTPNECYRATQEALIATVATMIESGQQPPLPSSAKKRTVQVNIKLTAEEKLLLSGAAKSFGYKGLSDFLRRAALKQVYSMP